MAPEFYPLIFIINATASLFLLGVIWQVQILQYPGFQLINVSEFPKHHAFHTRRISYVVVLPMLLELGTSLLLLFIDFKQHNTINRIGFILVLAIWVSTFFIQVPLHNKLKNEAGNTANTVKRLVRTNWIRTFLWSLKTILVAVAIFLLFE